MSQRLHRLVQVTEGLLSQPRARAGAREWGFGSVFTDHLSPWLREREESRGITLDRLYYLWMWECYTTNNVTQVWEHEISWCDSWWWVHSAWDDHYTMSHSTEGERGQGHFVTICQMTIVWWLGTRHTSLALCHCLTQLPVPVGNSAV